jgi:hypothetical protein
MQSLLQGVPSCMHEMTHFLMSKVKSCIVQLAIHDVNNAAFGILMNMPMHEMSENLLLRIQ